MTNDIVTMTAPVLIRKHPKTGSYEYTFHNPGPASLIMPPYKPPNFADTVRQFWDGSAVGIALEPTGNDTVGIFIKRHRRDTYPLNAGTTDDVQYFVTGVGQRMSLICAITEADVRAIFNHVGTLPEIGK